MLPNKLEYRNYKQFEAHSFLQDVGQLPKILVMRNGKKILWKYSTNTPLSKRKWFEEIINLLLQKFEKGNYEMISFEKQGKYLK